MLPPIDTMLILGTTASGKAVHYTSYMKGRSRFGVRVTVPQVLNQQYTPPAGTKLDCTYVLGNKLCSFLTEIVGYEPGSPPYMMLQEPKEITESNRRDSLRLPKQVALSYVLEGSRLGEHTTTVDVSMGGLSMYTTNLLTRGSSVALNLELPEQTVFLTGRIAWSAYKGKRPVAGVEFQRVAPSVEKQLYRYIVIAERELRT